MNKMSQGLLGGLVLLSFASAGCAGTPAAPFDTLKNSQLIAFRLQNYEPPTPPPGAAAPPGGGLIPGFPPEIQSWIGQGARACSSSSPGPVAVRECCKARPASSRAGSRRSDPALSRLSHPAANAGDRCRLEG